jgi:hypothetical protein
MDARLNMSLDDLIKSKPRSGGPGRGDRAGKARQGSRGGKGGKPAVAKARGEGFICPADDESLSYRCI